MWQWLKLNTFRKQMFVVYTSMMLAILLTIGIYINVQVSQLLQTNAEKHMNNTAVQSIANVELLMQQIDTFSSQVATNALVQTIMQDSYSGIAVSFDQLQLLQQEVRKMEAYQVGIKAIEIYTLNHESYLPISNERLNERYTQEWITASNLAQGKLVWTNYSERYGNSIVTIRNIRLMNQSFQHVGYLVIHVDPSLFDLSSVADMEQSEHQDFLWLTDQLGNVIFTNTSTEISLPEATGEMDVVDINDRDYFNVKRSISMANWELSILTPVTKATEGLALLRSTIIISLIVSSMLFLILSFFIADRISRPILKLIRAMRGARLGGGGLKHIDEPSNSIEINELNNTYNQMVDSLQALIQVVYEKEILQSQTELKALQAQINPHFLFNTLEAFYWELEEKGQSELAEVIVAMSGVFRYVITKQDSDQWVTIGDELEHAERYLLIMKMRLMDRFEWEIHCAEEHRHVPIPKLMVQPIIENAIEHGIERSLHRGKLIIDVARVSTHHIAITVKDNGPGFTSEQLHKITHDLNQGSLQIGDKSDKHLGVGLKNTHQRLKLSFGMETEGLSIKSSQQETEIGFRIPIESRGI